MSPFDQIIEKINNPEKIKEREDKIKFYQDKVDIFLDKVELWLKDYVERNVLSIKRYPKKWDLYEDDLGKYHVDWMRINIGGYEINLTPQGSVILGAMGRIDMRCERNKVIFLLINKDIEDLNELTIEASNNSDNDHKAPEWKEVINGLPDRYIEIDKERFLNSLAFVMNGKEN